MNASSMHADDINKGYHASSWGFCRSFTCMVLAFTCLDTLPFLRRWTKTRTTCPWQQRLSGIIFENSWGGASIFIFSQALHKSALAILPDSRRQIACLVFPARLQRLQVDALHAHEPYHMLDGVWIHAKPYIIAWMSRLDASHIKRHCAVHARHLEFHGQKRIPNLL